jgi:hypothetical protein
LSVTLFVVGYCPRAAEPEGLRRKEWLRRRGGRLRRRGRLRLRRGRLRRGRLRRGRLGRERLRRRISKKIRAFVFRLIFHLLNKLGKSLRL